MALLFFVIGRKPMNAPRREPHARMRPTHTYWPGSRRSEPPPGAAQRSPEAHGDEKKDEEPAADEPGYGHGV
jgi:hypothetical protein